MKNNFEVKKLRKYIYLFILIFFSLRVDILTFCKTILFLMCNNGVSDENLISM